MFYRTLGNSGLKISSIGLGTMNFGREGWGCSEEEGKKIFEYYIEAGGNFVDSADMYANGTGEEIVGRIIKGKREKIILTTKGCEPLPGSQLNYRGASRKNIIAALNNSLKKLGTDYIDLYYLHHWDPTTPILEQVSVLTDLIRSGKVRYVGVSNFTGWQISELASIWKNDKRFEPIISVQNQYSMICRGIEFEVIPSCLYNNIDIVCWSPTGGGVLAGIYDKDGKGPKDERYSPNNPDKKWDTYRFVTDKNIRIAQAVERFAKKLNTHPSTLAIAWVINRPAIGSALVGPKKLDHLKTSIAARELEIPIEILEELEKVSNPELPYEMPYPYIVQNEYVPNYYSGFKNAFGQVIEKKLKSYY